MATIVYHMAEKHSKSGFAGGFARVLGKGDGFSKKYVFGQGEDDVAPGDVAFRHVAEGDDLALFEEMIADGRLPKAEFRIEDGDTTEAAQHALGRAQRAALVRARAEHEAATGNPPPADPTGATTGGQPARRP